MVRGTGSIDFDDLCGGMEGREETSEKQSEESRCLFQGKTLPVQLKRLNKGVYERNGSEGELFEVEIRAGRSLRLGSA
jgi:hypothetical protein